MDTIRKEFRVFTLSFADYLTQKGFTEFRIVPDLLSPNKINWLFPRSPELTAAIDEYLAANGKDEQ